MPRGPVQVRIINNQSSSMAALLVSGLSDAQDTRMAVAFVSKAGLDLLRPAIDGALARDATLEFLVGLDMEITDPAALQDLYNLSRQSLQARLYCYASATAIAMYHPKLYLMRRNSNVTTIVGSSNLTPAGLERNVEVNAVLSGTTRDGAIAEAYDTYEHLKRLPGRFLPDEELVDLYKELGARRRSRQRELERDPAIAQLRTAYKAKLAALRVDNRPQLGKRNLVGWLELIYDSLPNGNFTNAQAYANLEFYSSYYPNNVNIKAKIRQKLQDLRDIGLIEWRGHGRWYRL